MKKISENVLYLTILKALNIIIPFICTPYISRVLGADNVGIYSYTNSLASYFAMFAALGTMWYGSREISRNREDKYIRSKIFWEIELITIVTTIICLIAWAIFVVNVSEYQTFYLILGINILAVLFDVTWFFYGMEDYKKLVICILFIKILSVAAIFTLVNNENGLPVYFIIMVLTQLLMNIIVWPLLKQYIIFVPFRELQFKKHIKETMVYFVPSVATSVYTILDKTFLGMIKNSKYESGCYENAEIIMSIAKGISFSAVNIVVGIRNSYLYEKKATDEVKNNIAMSLDFAMFMASGFMFGLCGVAGNMTLLYLGEGYDLVVPLIYILSPTILLIGISDCLGSQYYIPVGKRNISARFIVIGALLNIVFNGLLIPGFGAKGASVATIIAELSIVVLYIIFAREYCSVATIFKCTYKKLIAGLVMFICIFAIDRLALNYIYRLLLQIASGITVYLAVLAIIKDQFVLDIWQIIKNRAVK